MANSLFFVNFLLKFFKNGYASFYYHFNLKIILLLIVVELVVHQLYFALTFIFKKFCNLLDGHNPALNLKNT